MLIHRSAMLMHRPAMLMHRPAMLMHRSVMLMHRQTNYIARKLLACGRLLSVRENYIFVSVNKDIMDVILLAPN